MPPQESYIRTSRKEYMCMSINKNLFLQFFKLNSTHRVHFVKFYPSVKLSFQSELPPCTSWHFLDSFLGVRLWGVSSHLLASSWTFYVEDDKSVCFCCISTVWWRYISMTHPRPVASELFSGQPLQNLFEVQTPHRSVIKLRLCQLVAVLRVLLGVLDKSFFFG